MEKLSWNLECSCLGRQEHHRKQLRHTCHFTDSQQLLHCVQPDAYEDIWHLLIPPTMTLLDDYQAEHKLEGVRVISFMLHTIPQKTLLRTGVNELIFSVRFSFLGYGY